MDMDSHGRLRVDPFLPRGQKRTRSQLESEDQDIYLAGPSSRTPPSPFHHASRRPSPAVHHHHHHHHHSARCPFANTHSRRLVFPPMPSSGPPRFDFSTPPRRPQPVMPAPRVDSRADVIDLTCDDGDGNNSPTNSSGSLGDASRAPRFANDIIEIDNSSPGQDRSPEVQFVSSRPLLIPQHPQGQNPVDQPALVVLDDEDDAGFEITGSNVLNPGPRLSTPPHPSSIHRLFTLFSQTASTSQVFSSMIRSGAAFVPPVLNFANVDVAIDLGLDRQETASPPAYTAPAPAPEGFTRSPAENDVLVCPNCNDELSTGESDLKKQVWVIKGCGHVYCGECTVGRYASKQKKAKAPAKTKPFRECVIEGCNARTSAPKAMIQLFL